MRDPECTEFLKWCLPRLGLRWAGFRKVRRTVCKRVSRRLRELDLEDVSAYRRYLGCHPEEWRHLEGLCRIPISRFWRDKTVFEWLAEEGFVGLAKAADAAGRTAVRCWSAGCASGEEVYSLRMAWLKKAERYWPAIRLVIVATDADTTMLNRARAGSYSVGSLRDLPEACRDRWFIPEEGDFSLAEALRHDPDTVFKLQDIREEMPEGRFDLILCRNLAFTYFEREHQHAVLGRLMDRLRDRGLLVIGAHEQLPDRNADFAPAADHLPIYRLDREGWTETNS